MIHFGDHAVHRVFKRIVDRHARKEVAAHPDLAAVFLLCIGARMIDQLRKVLFDRAHLKLVHVAVRPRFRGVAHLAVAQVLTDVKGVQIERLVPLRKRAVCAFVFQIAAELLDAILAETAARPHRGDRQLRFVELDAGHARIDLQLHDLLEIPAPHGIVAAGLIAGFGMSPDLHPARMHGLSAECARGSLLLQRRDSFAVAVADPVRIVVLQGRAEQSVVFAGGELVEPVSCPGTVGRSFAQDVERLHMPAVLRNLDRKLPALHLEHDAHGANAALAAFGDELGIVHKAVEPQPRIKLAERLVFEIRQGNRAAAQCGPDEDRRAVSFEILDHLHGAIRKTRVVAMIVMIPPVKVDASFHKRFLSGYLSLYIRLISD